MTVPAFAGMTVPAFAGMTVPAFAGMTFAIWENGGGLKMLAFLSPHHLLPRIFVILA